MTEYTASNGVVLKMPLWTDDTIMDAVTKYGAGPVVAALREFFQKERDDELGRWRWPENPDIYVRPLNDAVVGVVKDDRDGLAYTQVGRNDDRSHLDPMIRAARAYFDAYLEPKPWHDAKPGEVWLVTVDWSEDIVCTVSSSGPDFEPVQNPVWATIARGSDRIKDARRIWPEST